MAARSPRRSFAAPFVLVSFAACHHEPPYEPIHDNPPAPRSDAAIAGSAATPVTPGVGGSDNSPPPAPVPRHTVNPPRPHVLPPADSEPPGRHWTVSKLNGTCEAFDAGACGHVPPGQPIPPCNPPPPIPYACLPQVTEHGFVKIVQPPDGTVCMIEPEAMHCPPGTMCNPPRPQEVPCPGAKPAPKK